MNQQMPTDERKTVKIKPDVANDWDRLKPAELTSSGFVARLLDLYETETNDDGEGSDSSEINELAELIEDNRKETEKLREEVGRLPDRTATEVFDRKEN